MADQPLITEGGDPLITEGGDGLITEQGSGEGVGAASGAGAAAGIGAAIAAAVGAASGSGAAFGIVLGGASGSASGTGTAAGVGASVAAAVGSASGTGSALGAAPGATLAELLHGSMWGLAIYGVDTIGFAVPLPALDGHLGLDLLLIAEPFEAVIAGPPSDIDIFPPFGALPDGWSDSGLVRRTLYVAATTGRSTANDDEPPAQYVAGRLKPFNFGARLFEGADPLRRPGANEGVFSMIDPDDELSGLADQVWDGTPLTLKRGPRDGLFVDWPLIGRYRGAGLVRDLDEKQIRLRDNAWALTGALHGETYAGTGELEGSADITGRLKPWALGYCFNVEPVLLSPTDQIFQWSLSSSQELVSFRHGGVEIAVSADYATYAELAAASIPSGRCATCLAYSLVRPNLTLEFGVRVDVVGDADTVNGHTTPLTRASIVRRIATARGPNTLDDDTELDFHSFVRMEEQHPAPVGWYFDSAMSKADALNRVLAGILGWWRVKPNGRMAIGWVVAPELTPPVVVLSSPVSDVGKPRLIDTAPPRRGTRITYRWNYAPVSDRAALAGSVTDANAALYIQPTSYGQSLNLTLASLWPTAQIVTIDQAGFRDEADASAEAVRQQNIWSVERKRWARDMQIDPFVDLLGKGFQIDDDPLLQGGSSVQLCVAVEAVGASINTFEFFT